MISSVAVPVRVLIVDALIVSEVFPSRVLRTDAARVPVSVIAHFQDLRFRRGISCD